MMMHGFLPLVVSMSALVSLPAQILAQSADVKARNTNQSARFKSAIFKGSANLIASNAITSFIGGGQSNRITIGAYSGVIGGGSANTVSGEAATVGGGYFNRAVATAATVAGGETNTADGYAATVAGGFVNSAFGEVSVVGGGASNMILSNGLLATIAGGSLNTNSADSGTIGGGNHNFLSGEGGTIAGGSTNQIGPLGVVAVISGGSRHTNHGDSAVIGGGFLNTVPETGVAATISGGESNTASGQHAMVPGGYLNEASGDASLAAGHRARATKNGQFVWADSQDENFDPGEAAPPNSFYVRAEGGAYFTSGRDDPNQMIGWAPGQGGWNVASDATIKEQFRTIEPREVLRRLTMVPITEWSYIGYRQRHIGPTAQDWHAAFSISDDDKTINTVHMHGVSLAAIQGLMEEIKLRDAAIEELKMKSAEVDELKAKLQAFEERLDSLPSAP